MYIRNVILALFIALCGVRSQGGIFSGTNAVSAVYYGSNVVTAVYYGSNLVWSSVVPSERTDFGAWMHLDASYAASISNQPSAGTNFVYQWTDWRGGPYARQDIYFTGIPFVSNAFQNGKNVVRLQPFIGTGAREGPNLRLSEDKTDIYAVFAVLMLCNDCEYVPFLGGYSTSAFHGSTGGQLIHPEWSDPKVYGGSNSMDGVSMTVATIYPTNRFHVVSVRTSGGGAAANNLGRDRSVRAGGIDFAELLIFTNPVSDAATAQINAYLKAKWATP